MGETHMRQILRDAKQSNPNIKNLQDVVKLDDRSMGIKMMGLLDESYKYYPKVLAAGRIYKTYKTNKGQFKRNVKQYIDMPITRKPSLAEEYPRFGNKQYKDKEDMLTAMCDGELFGAKAHKEVRFKKIGECSKDKEEVALMHMTSKAVR